MGAVFLVVLAQAALASQADSVYSSPYVRALVERASASNRRVPDSLRAYGATVETEMAFIARQPDGVEQTFTVEQFASVVRWKRTGEYEQRVIGYRSQSVGVTISALGLFRQAWTVPFLYGDRITMLLGQLDSTRHANRGRRQRTDAVVAVHPFAEDREQVYHFSGGDTVVTIRPGRRDIPIVRVHVEPHGDRLTQRATAFRGDIDLDEHRAQIVRMRGSFVTIGPRPKTRFRRIASQFEAIAYIELENGEFDQRYWLPTSQRVEVHAAFSFFGNQRAVFRVLSHFRSMVVNPGDSTVVLVRLDSSGQASVDDSLRVLAHRLTFAPTDSIDRFKAWSRGIGEQTATAHADDFADLAPDSWRPTGRPVLRLRLRQPSDLFHYNRVEGPYTGVGGEGALRDASHGWMGRATVGWDWFERTSRGRISVERQAGRVWPSIRAGRSLDITNDFREPFDSGSTLGSLVSVDDYDYVDRRHALVGLTWFPDRRRRVRLGLEAGVASDRYAPARRDRGPLARGDSGFRFNRGVDEGAYRTASLKLDFHPDVSAAYVRPGVGALVQAEIASGDLAWRRIEIRLIARRAIGPIVYAGRADAGVITGRSIPPQQLFELGENQNLPGYGYKEFAGNQAAVIRGLAMYPFPFWRTPLRLGRFAFSGVAPMISFGAQGGWASATNDAARSSILRLGAVGDSVLGRPGVTSGRPVSRPSDGFKTSIDFRLRFFGGAVSAGVARATDHHQGWELVLGLAQVI